MKQIDSIAGKCYIATAPNGGTVTDEAGRILATVEAGEQKAVWGTDGKLYLSDDDGKLVLATFNYALAAAGLLGGGQHSGLPDGYLQAYFLQDKGGQYLVTDVVPTNKTGILLDAMPLTDNDTIPVGCRNSESAETRFYAVRPRRKVINKNTIVNNGYGWGKWFVFAPEVLDFGKILREKTLLNWKNNRWAVTPNGSLYLFSLSFAPTLPMFIFATNIGGNAALFYAGRIWNVGISQGDEIILNYVPAVTDNGKPCMIDTPSASVLTNQGSDDFIVGFTLSQARKLGKLAPGSSFTICLPAGWQEDAGVAAAKAQAEAKGCVLPVQEYTESEAAAATYALRRIWVRRTPDALGTYVAADGTRWLVEQCVDVWGADPETLGYERFRSVDAAVEYWGLTPYVYPEEELSTEA